MFTFTARWLRRTLDSIATTPERSPWAPHEDLARKLAALEKKYDAHFEQRPIGFGTGRSAERQAAMAEKRLKIWYERATCSASRSCG